MSNTVCKSTKVLLGQVKSSFCSKVVMLAYVSTHACTHVSRFACIQVFVLWWFLQESDLEKELQVGFKKRLESEVLTRDKMDAENYKDNIVISASCYRTEMESQNFFVSGNLNFTDGRSGQMVYACACVSNIGEYFDTCFMCISLHRMKKN